MQVTPSPWAGSCPEASCLRVTYTARTVSVCPSLALCSPSPVPSALPESDFARLRKRRSFMGVCSTCSEGSARRAGSVRQRRQPAGTESLPKAAAVPARHEHPQHAAPSDQRVQQPVAPKICPYVSNAAVSTRKTLKYIPIDLHGILQVYMTCH